MPSTRITHYQPFLRRLRVHVNLDSDEEAFDDYAEAYVLVNAVFRPLLRPERLTIPNVQFRLSDFTDEDCNFFFRFTEEEIKDLTIELNIPGTVICPDTRSRAHGYEALAIVLRRMSYPNRWGELQRFFGRSERALRSFYWILAEDLTRRYRNIIYLDVDRIRPLLATYAQVSLSCVAKRCVCAFCGYASVRVICP